MEQICPWCHKTTVLSEYEDDKSEYYSGFCGCGAEFIIRPPTGLEETTVVIEHLQDLLPAHLFYEEYDHGGYENGNLKDFLP